MIGWNFPSNGGGQIRGIAEAGIETFTGKKISSLAREICQNSLDAAADENFPVTVEFHRHNIATADIPDRDDFQKILRRCRAYWAGNIKTQAFFTAAIRQIDSLMTSVLRISDFNTTGLAEPFNSCAKDGWNALTKIDGGATKSGDAAGSFGIGKNAPFTNSYWRMIFYRTLNSDGERAAQGIARLVSFDMGGGEISAGVGYCGDEKNSPVKEIPALEKIYRRDVRGTDVFVYGFNGGANWRDEISVELIENFLVAIHRDKLRVRIHGDDLTCDTLKNFVRRYADKLTTAADYHRILSGEGDVKTFPCDFHGMGTLKLRVIVDGRAELNRRVLVVRKNGMKLFDMKKFPRTLSFTGILELEGRELNEFFRDMEPPSHDGWEPSRHRNSTLAQEYLTELKRWVRDTVSSLGDENFSDEVNVEGLSELLAFDDGAIIGGTSTTLETLDTPATPTPVHELKPDIDGGKNISASGGYDNSATRQTAGDITSDGGLSAVRTLKGTRPRKTSATHSGEQNPAGADIVREPVGKRVACKKIRVIKVGDKTYRLILNVAQNISGGKIFIGAVGENGARENLPVRCVNFANVSGVQTVGDKITFANLRGGYEARITFELRDEQNYALGVDVVED